MSTRKKKAVSPLAKAMAITGAEKPVARPTGYTTTGGVRFYATKEERWFVDTAAARARNLYAANSRHVDTVSISMDLVATHSNGCPLDFKRLTDFPDFDFMHDIAGIERHLDRTTGKLTDHFLPRCAKPATT